MRTRYGGEPEPVMLRETLPHCVGVLSKVKLNAAASDGREAATTVARTSIVVDDVFVVVHDEEPGRRWINAGWWSSERKTISTRHGHGDVNPAGASGLLLKVLLQVCRDPLAIQLIHFYDCTVFHDVQDLGLAAVALKNEIILIMRMNSFALVYCRSAPARKSRRNRSDLIPDAEFRIPTYHPIIMHRQMLLEQIPSSGLPRSSGGSYDGSYVGWSKCRHVMLIETRGQHNAHTMLNPSSNG